MPSHFNCFHLVITMDPTGNMFLTFVGYPNFIIIVQSFHIHNHHNIIYYLHLYILIYYIHKIVLYNAVE